MDGRRLFNANEFLWNRNQVLEAQNRRLQSRLSACERERNQALRRAEESERQRRQLQEQNAGLKQRVADLTAQLKNHKKKPKPAPPAPPAPPTPPAFVKPNVPPKKPPRKPGRKSGHAAALRPMPQKIDVHQEVPLPIDEQGKASCPQCRTQLNDVKQHQRLVEEIIPQQVVTTCYHTTSGYCPSCRKQVESRAEEQPPAADLPHAQLGLNALATAAVLRVCYRLPLRQITRLFAQLPGLKISPGGIVKQLHRLAAWLEKQYHRLKLVLRAAGVVYVDESGWRTNGKNGYLWTLTNDQHTLYHVDRSRSGRVLAELLGEAFGSGDGTLVSDFYGVYDQMEGSQQKCLAHLLRELGDTLARRPELVQDRCYPFFRRCKRLVKEMLRLKGRRQELGAEDYAHRVELLERRLEKLGESNWKDADATRLAGRLRKHRNKLTTFLHKQEVEGTNNMAERALRPAVVMRKITGGSRSARGARSWSILTSVMRTAEQQGRDVLDTLKTLLKAEWAGKNIGLLTDAM